MQKFKHKGVQVMLSDELLSKILNNKHTKEIPLIYVWECITAFEQSVRDIKENNYDDATLDKLLDD